MNILYVMHVPWGWAKQRPHFLSIGLSKRHNIYIRFLKSYRKSNLKSEPSGKMNIQEIFILPLGNQFKLIWLLNNMLIRFQLKRSVKNTDVLWITSPQLSFLTENCNARKIVYDCMDDFLEFPAIKNSIWLKKKILAMEASLFLKSDIVFFSSEVLRQRVLSRNNHLKTLNTYVINNAISLPTGFEENINENKDHQKIKIVYVGTISEWFDFDLLLKHVRADSNVTYEIYGPTEIKVQSHERIYFKGPILHSKVFSVIASADILVMPFIVNDLIRAVNPVKLYEYIYIGKPVLVPRYEESTKFEDFVFLYESHDDFIQKCRNIVTSGCKAKNTLEECRKFASENTWDKRVEHINLLIKKIIE